MQEDDVLDCVLEVGFTKPFPLVQLSDREDLLSTITTYHLFIKVKAVIDQFIAGRTLKIDPDLPDCNPLPSVSITHASIMALTERTPFINCVPTLVPQIRKLYARIAIGEKGSKDLSFCLHDGTLDIAVTFHQDGWLYRDFSAP